MLDAGGLGARGKLGEARRSAVNTVEAVALAGEAQIIGAGQILAAAARWNSGGLLLVECLRETMGKWAQGTRHNTGRRESKRGAAGAHGDGRKSQNTAAGTATPTSDWG